MTAGLRAVAPERELLPLEPLLRQIRLRGGPAAVGAANRTAGAKDLERARAAGGLTYAAADRLAVRLLGVTPRELWPEVWAD